MRRVRTGTTKTTAAARQLAATLPPVYRRANRKKSGARVTMPTFSARSQAALAATDPATVSPA